MPGRHFIQNAAVRAFHRWPATQRLTLRTLDLLYQIALLPFRRSRSTGPATDQRALAAKTDSYNAAAEEYFAKFSNSDFLLDKPFSDTHQTAKHLIDAGILIDAMRLKPGDTVVELGAGSCWLSHMLNRFGCRTISIDVSPTVVALGRTLFQRDPRTNWTLEPQFVTYDGHGIPLSDASCDRVVTNDAFHHIPNQRQLLSEMHRILVSDGVVAMSEPGRGHGSADQSLQEANATGVLENELALDDFSALARECGFAHVNVVVASPMARREIAAAELGAFMGGKGFAGYWKTFCSALEQQHYILCYKGAAAPSTDRPARVSARIEISSGATIDVRAGQPVHATVRLTNTADTHWRSQPGAGWTRLGAHLYRDGTAPQLIDFDWLRTELNGDVEPGASRTLDLTLPPLSPGVYLTVFDLVIEGTAWFADRGSKTASLEIRVSP